MPTESHRATPAAGGSRSETRQQLDQDKPLEKVKALPAVSFCLFIMKTVNQTTAWSIPQLPMDWVVEHKGEFWIVPAASNRWSRKRPYKGHHPAKITNAHKAKKYMLFSVGVPFSTTK